MTKMLDFKDELLFDYSPQTASPSISRRSDACQLPGQVSRQATAFATEDTEIAENRNGAINVTATAMATATA
jgi:hypothetical protein